MRLFSPLRDTLFLFSAAASLENVEGADSSKLGILVSALAIILAELTFFFIFQETKKHITW